MTKEEMIKLAIENLERAGVKEIELQGAVSDSNKDFRVRVVKAEPLVITTSSAPGEVKLTD